MTSLRNRLWEYLAGKTIDLDILLCGGIIVLCILGVFGYIAVDLLWYLL